VQADAIAFGICDVREATHVAGKLNLGVVMRPPALATRASTASSERPALR